MNRLKILDISNNLGDTKSLITHPATTTHRVLERKKVFSLNIGQKTNSNFCGTNFLDIFQDIDQILVIYKTPESF